MSRDVGESADQIFSDVSGGNIPKSVDRSREKMPRRTFLKLVTKMLQGFEIYRMGQKMGLITKPTESYNDQEYMTQWDLEWGGHIRKSFGNMVRVMQDYEASEYKDKISRKEILEAWISFHGLEIYLRTSNAKLALQGLNKYINLVSVDKDPNRFRDWNTTIDPEVETNLMAEHDANYLGFASDMIAAAFASEEESLPRIFHPDNYYVTEFFRQNKYNINFDDKNASEPLRIVNTVKHLGRKAEQKGGFEFTRYFGFGTGSPWQSSLALLLGKQAKWQIGITKSDESFFQDVSMLPNSLDVAINTSKIGDIRFESKFGAEQFPMQGLHIFRDDIANALYSVVNTIIPRLGERAEQNTILGEMQEILDELQRDVAPNLVRDGFLEVSPQDFLEDRGETRVPSYDYMLITNKMMEILETVGLATPLKITGSYRPLFAQFAKEGSVINGVPPQYKYSFGLNLYNNSQDLKEIPREVII